MKELSFQKVQWFVVGKGELSPPPTATIELEPLVFWGLLGSFRILDIKWVDTL